MRILYVAMCTAAALIGTAANASTTLTFEGVGNFNPIGNYYNGGAGGNYGITFGPDSLGLVSAADGGSGNFSNNPSGDTIAFFLSGPGDVMDVAGGFDTGFSFYYAGYPGSVSVYSGLDGTGSLLATLALPGTPSPYTVWVPIGVAFAGTAQSAVFSGSANYIGFDNITLGAVTPGGAVPEPATWAMMLLGFGAIGLAARRRRKQKPSYSPQVA